MQTPPDTLGGSAAGALLKVDTRVSDDAYLIEVAGELDRSTVGILESHLGDAGLSDRSRILVDLGRLAFIDSAGLRALLGAAGAEATRDRVRVVAPSRAVRRVLQLTGTEAHLPVA